MDASLSWSAARPRPWVSGAVLLGHAALLWALLQLDAVDRVLREAAPLVVRIVSLAPERAPEPSPPALTPPRLATLPPASFAVPEIEVPEIEVPRPPAPAPAVAVIVASVVEPAPATPAPPAPALPVVPTTAFAALAPPPPPPPPAPMKVAASQLRYLVEPPIEVPRASRRLREQGTVLLQVVVDIRGQPRDVRLARSSGFERLDQQALSAMRRARFVPCTADSQPVECESVAPFVYELEN